MWKVGQLVTIDNKVYRITKTDGNRLKACCMCCGVNRPIPCGGRFNYSGQEEEFWRGTCLEKVPEGCYLRPISNDKTGTRHLSLIVIDMDDLYIDLVSSMQGLFFIFVIIFATYIIGKEMRKRRW